MRVVEAWRDAPQSWPRSTSACILARRKCAKYSKEVAVHDVIYLVGLVVVVMFVLSLLGLR